ncbi:MAG TPA: transglutaminase-like domain-containing protein [Candidatus Sulfotelmatobacter sp.]|jgi:regulator of sirC expression with transglutaminase-like and TPR domain|nr:transglutaminase-like domain-containing protein [Candidatus Sulfotelmatobacter sp.]
MHYTAPAELLETFSVFVNPEIEDEKIDLIRAALVIARTEYPHLEIEEYAGRVEGLARRVASEVSDTEQPTLDSLNRVLFDEARLRGNREDYYDPRNSFLNDVLERGLGIPITLSIVYMEVAKRVGFHLSGVGMPGHFLLKHYGHDGRETLIDCFNRGDILSRQDCQTRLNEIYSGEMQLQPEFLHPLSRRQILTRVLNNLKTVYLSTRNFRKALPIADLVLVIYPQSAEDLKQRAFLRYSMGMQRLAAEDLEEYLKISPSASDAEEIRHMSTSVRHMLAMMN